MTVSLLGLFATACENKSQTTGLVALTIAVSPNPQTLAVNASQQFSAVGKDASGANVTVTPVWSVVAGGGTISSSGLFTAGTAAGTFTSTVMATSNGLSSTATVIVTAGPLATITLTPSPVSIAVGTTQQFTAVGKDASGNIVQFTPTWSIMAGGGTTNTTGLFTAGMVSGTFTNTIQANSGGISANATITITGPPVMSIVVTPNPVSLRVGATQQFTAVSRDAAGNVLQVTPAWSVLTGGGTINSAGLFTAGATPGTFNNTIQAASGGITGTASVTVTTVGPLATIIVTPNPVTLAIGAAQQFTAIGKDAAGNDVPITSTWSVVAGGGTISSSGLFTAGTTQGVFANTVQASSGGLTGTATVNVAPGPLASITVIPNPAVLEVGSSQTFVAVGKDAQGNTVQITPTWSVVNGGGTMDGGNFNAGTVAGTFPNTVKATSGNISGTATVTVTPGPLVAIFVTPNPANVIPGGTKQFTATGKDANGNVVAIAPATWAVVNGGGSINAGTGLFTAGLIAGTYSNTVQATSGLLTGTATVNVTPGALTTIVISPNPASVPTNATQQFTAVAIDANGNIIAISPLWTIVNGGGTINSNTGLFTAGAVAGPFANTVQATNGGLTATATVNVTAAPTPPAGIVNLGTAAANGIMAGQSVTCVDLGIIHADVSISPGNTITGFGPCVITGVKHLNDAVAIQGQIDLTAAYNTLAGLPCGTAIVGNLGGTTKAAGVYCTASSIGVTGVLTLDGGGNSNATFVFQAGSTLTTAGSIVLINGAQAKNVYWQVGSSATIGTASQWQGNILALTSITLVDNATLIGRALARNGSVTLGTNNVIILP